MYPEWQCPEHRFCAGCCKGLTPGVCNPPNHREGTIHISQEKQRSEGPNHLPKRQDRPPDAEMRLHTYDTTSVSFPALGHSLWSEGHFPFQLMLAPLCFRPPCQVQGRFRKGTSRPCRPPGCLALAETAIVGHSLCADVRPPWERTFH